MQEHQTHYYLPNKFIGRGHSFSDIKKLNNSSTFAVINRVGSCNKKCFIELVPGDALLTGFAGRCLTWASEAVAAAGWDGETGLDTARQMYPGWRLDLLVLQIAFHILRSQRCEVWVPALCYLVALLVSFDLAAVEIVEADADDAGVRTGVVVASVAAEGIEVVAPAGCC